VKAGPSNGSPYSETEESLARKLWAQGVTAKEAVKYFPDRGRKSLEYKFRKIQKEGTCVLSYDEWLQHTFFSKLED
jgi:hypothetical protein